jgi:hypothetical protein
LCGACRRSFASRRRTGTMVSLKTMRRRITRVRPSLKAAGSWTTSRTRVTQYVLIDIIPHAATLLRAYAAQWRGFSALEPTLPPHAGPYALRLRRATASGPDVTTPALFILYHLVHIRHPPAHLRLAHRPPRDPTHST